MNKITSFFFLVLLFIVIINNDIPIQYFAIKSSNLIFIKTLDTPIIFTKMLSYPFISLIQPLLMLAALLAVCFLPSTVKDAHNTEVEMNPISMAPTKPEKSHHVEPLHESVPLTYADAVGYKYMESQKPQNTDFIGYAEVSLVELFWQPDPLPVVSQLEPTVQFTFTYAEAVLYTAMETQNSISIGKTDASLLSATRSHDDSMDLADSQLHPQSTLTFKPNSVSTDWSLGKVSSLEPVSYSAKSSNELSQKDFDLIQSILNCFSGINFDKASTKRLSIPKNVFVRINHGTNFFKIKKTFRF